ncbi:hypothetical protein [Clostridium sp. MD294]|uniref:hypothetical protein n=1 Tax=Clostridium sp. MD294 TaxID=97138 RepID=UPI0002CB0089|nr:hypothetical protein [Clostridium sp. MD294]USF30469.1 hypothetical protein C820_001910 [Clostridium sp. MD294]
MLIMRQYDGIISAQNEKNSTIFKKTVTHGSVQQTIKQQNGNFINYDYELIHHMDLL